jgi:hypothetical protein
MIRDGFCSNCKCYHYPNRLYDDDCGRPFVPLKRPTQPTTSEQLYLQRRDMELRHAIEARERRQAAEQVERARGKALAILREHLQLWHQERSAEIAAQAAQLRGELSAAREQRDQQARARRLDRNLQQREAP